MTQPSFAPDPGESVDLCVIGAGISGLNALFVASQYLPPTARVILIEATPGCGGMWQDTYDYVRLHQPHPYFTVGDLPWQWQKPGTHLASGPEVQAHLQSCLNRIRSRFQLQELYNTKATSVSEVASPDGWHAQVVAETATGSINFTARRVIHATGWDIPKIEPLQLSSNAVRTTSPSQLSHDDTDPSAPAWVIGGGKTGMDTVLALLDRAPDRQVSLVNGKGTVFGNRDQMFPTGISRYWRGDMVGSISANVTRRFNGQNPAEAFDYFKQAYAISPDGSGEEYMFSTMSKAEAQRIHQGLHQTLPGYLQDVQDTSDGPKALFRNGDQADLSPGSLIVNCTGHLLKQPRDKVPLLSPQETILTLSPRNSVYFLSTSAGYFTTHAFLLGRLPKMPLYLLDMDSLKGRDPHLFFLTCLTHSFHNMLTFMDHLPLSVFSRCGLDINRWYPLPRRLWSFAKLKLGQRRNISHCRAVLDDLNAKQGISCVPLNELG